MEVTKQLTKLKLGQPVILYWADAYSDDTDTVHIDPLTQTPALRIDTSYALTVSPGYFIAYQDGWVRIAGCHYPNSKEAPYGETLTVPASWITKLTTFKEHPLDSRTPRRRR